MDSNEMIMTGKTVDEAVAKVLSIWQITKDDVLIKVEDSGSKGFLGLGQRPARVVVSLKFDPERTVKKFLHEVTSAIGLAITYKTKVGDGGKRLDITMDGENLGVLIGKHGMTLDSLQYLCNLVINKHKENDYVNINLDAQGYRSKRKEVLESLARSIAKKVKQTKRPTKLEAMGATERRVIHSALQEDKFISTYSEGIEPFRNVVITYKRDGAEGSGNKNFKGKKKSFSNTPRQPKDNYAKFITPKNDNSDE